MLALAGLGEDPLHAFDFVTVLLSFVYAAAIAHVLSTVGDMVMASKRLRVSWLNVGWMVVALFSTGAWWIGMWDLHELKSWSMPMIWFTFSMAAGFYLYCRLVCPRIPHEGPVDLPAFHAEEGRKYLAWYTVLATATVGANILFAKAHQGAQEMLAQNSTVGPMAIAAGVAAAFPRRRAIQAACLAVELAMWGLYYGFQQQALTG